MTNVGRKTFSKRLTAVFMALAMLVMSMPAADLTAFAEGAPWEGDGTASDPWRISTPEDLISMSEGVGNTMAGSVYSGKYFALVNDIDMSGQYMKPIGITAPFAGIFYGCNHTIKTCRSIIPLLMKSVCSQRQPTL